MSQQDDILKNLRQIIEEQGVESFHILEELVPIEQQMEYFRKFDAMRTDNINFNKQEEIEIIFSPYETIERKKTGFIRLASIPDVQAYRAIETYHNDPLEAELYNWSAMALVGSRIILSSDLSGQQQIYVSSGLGGFDKKLRFFSLFSTTTRESFTDLQKEIVEREFRFQMDKTEIEIEKFDIQDNYFTIHLLAPLDSDVRSSIDAAIAEINNYGNFLDPKFVFTNVKILNDQEIQRLLKKK